MSGNKSNQALVVVVLFIAIFFCCISMWFESAPQKTTDEIQMIQPCGWPWCAAYDSQYAERVNLPNSEANLNNSKGKWYKAQADKISSEIITAQAEIATTGFSAGILFTIIVSIGLGTMVFLIVASGKKQ